MRSAFSHCSRSPPVGLEELIGKVGTRSAYLILHSSERPDGSRQVAGEYVILATLTRRFVEGERSPQLGVTVLKEGITPILFGRPQIGELRGTWRDGTSRGRVSDQMARCARSSSSAKRFLRWRAIARTCAARRGKAAISRS